MSLCQLPWAPFKLNRSTIYHLFPFIYRLPLHHLFLINDRPPLHQSDYTHTVSTNTIQQKFNHMTWWHQPQTTPDTKQHESRCCVATNRASVDNMAFTANVTWIVAASGCWKKTFMVHASQKGRGNRPLGMQGASRLRDVHVFFFSEIGVLNEDF